MENLPEGLILQERYTIKQILGKGAMGTIYLAWDSRLSDEKAIKEMNLSFLEDAEKDQFMELFKQEAHMLSRLHHANLPKVIDYFFEQGRYYLVMDYIKGQNLKDYMEKNLSPPEMEKISKITLQLCDVLEYLHSQKPDPIIFRDLKPSNIMILPDFTVKLIDFGIARIFKENKKCDTIIVGTPGFAPPEQYGKRQTDERADIYSLGATLYYIMSGNVPDLPDQKGKKEIEENSRVAASLKPVIIKSLDAEPDKRYKTVTEFRDVFKKAIEQPLNLPVKQETYEKPKEKEKNALPAKSEGRVDNFMATTLTFLFMVLPAGAIAFLVSFVRLIIMPSLWKETTAMIISLLGAAALTGLWGLVIKYLRRIPGFNWEALIVITLPTALLVARNFFVLAVPEYQAGQWGLWSTLILLCVMLPLMVIVSLILIIFFRHQKKEIKETQDVQKKGKDYYIGKNATVITPMYPVGKIITDGDEEQLAARSQDSQYIKEGARVNIVGLKMGEFIVKVIDKGL